MDNGIKVKEIPSAKAVCTTHTGPYETLNYAYEAISRYAEEHNL
jgi:effector-binding domain-containing protein